MMNRLFPIIFFLSLASSLFAISPTDLTIEWIYSNSARKLTAMPKTYWLSDNRAVLYYSLENKLRLFNPQNGELVPLIDTEKALKQLGEFLGEDSPENLPGPDDIDKAGRRAVYRFSGDLYLLNFKNSKFRRLTKTDETEKSARFSPDGSKLAYVRENDLYIYLIDENREQRLTSDGSRNLLNGTLSWVYWEEIFGRHDIGYWWSPNSRSLAFLQSDDKDVSEMIYSDFRSQIPLNILQRYPKAGQKNPIVRLGFIQLDNPEVIWAGMDTATYEYLTRVKWLPDSRRCAVLTLNRQQTDMTMYLADSRTGGTDYVFTEKNSGWVNIHDDLHFLKDGTTFFWASERDGFNHLYRMSLEDTTAALLTPGQWAMASSGGEVAWVKRAVSGIDENNGWIYFTAMKKSSIERHLYRVRFDGANLTRLSQGEGTHRIHFSKDMNYYFDLYSNVHTPPVLSLHSADGSELMKVAVSRIEELHALGLQYPEFFTVPARDGFALPASLLKPADFDPAKKYPVIVNIYGGPAAPKVRNAWSSSNYFDNILLRNGYLVFKMDNRSSSAISKELTNLVTGQVMGEVELNDLLDAVDWLKKQPFVDAERVGIWGWSGGGMHTLQALTNSTEFKAGIAVAPVSDWHYYDTRYSEFGMKTPQSNPEGYEKTSLVKKAANLHGRLLLVHGTYDDNVHIQNSWAFADELIRNNIQFDMLIYPMRKHGISDKPARIHLFTAMLEFWKKNL